MNKILDIKNLRSYYGGICALDGVSLHINEGEITSIIGSNGAGKSTLMKVIAGDKPIDSGDVIFQGEPLPKAVHQVVAKGISLVPEGRRIFASLSVKENLILGTCPHKNFRKAMDDSLEEVFENREQIEISRYYEKLPKPTLIATQEYIEGKVYYRNPAKEKEKLQQV